MTSPADVAPYLLEQQQRLSRSCLWQLQRTFFAQQGPEAWRQGTVPHYVTSNPCMAQAYARVVVGFLRDALAFTSQSRTDDFALLDPCQPLYLVELGAGSGRFAYHFLKKLLTPAHRSLFHPLEIIYVMTDFAAQNLAAWRAHASLRPWVDEGVLDFAHYDAQDNQPLTLCHSDVVLATGTVANPLIMLANYVFDSIPQDAFTIHQSQLCEGLLTVSCPTPPAEPTDPAILAHLTLDYAWRPAAAAYYDDPEDNRILQGYQQRLDNTTVLCFPAWPWTACGISCTSLAVACCCSPRTRAASRENDLQLFSTVPSPLAGACAHGRQSAHRHDRHAQTSDSRTRQCPTALLKF